MLWDYSMQLLAICAQSPSAVVRTFWETSLGKGWIPRHQMGWGELWKDFTEGVQYLCERYKVDWYLTMWNYTCWAETVAKISLTNSDRITVAWAAQIAERRSLQYNCHLKEHKQPHLCLHAMDASMLARTKTRSQASVMLEKHAKKAVLIWKVKLSVDWQD